MNRTDIIMRIARRDLLKSIENIETKIEEHKSLYLGIEPEIKELKKLHTLLKWIE
jgi:hypothetical protein